jgi:hypothetical protein
MTPEEIEIIKYGDPWISAATVLKKVVDQLTPSELAVLIEWFDGNPDAAMDIVQRMADTLHDKEPESYYAMFGYPIHTIPVEGGPDKVCGGEIWEGRCHLCDALVEQD